MTTETNLALTRELFQLMKRFPRPNMALSTRKDMTRSEYELLGMLVMRLEGDQKALSIGEISDVLHITPAGVTHLINPLEEKGLVERLKDPSDRRVVLIGITEKGIGIAEELMAEIQEKLAGLIDFLGEDDSRKLIDLMTKVVEYSALNQD
jgi:DNA-binding MarR family transcriptional regulator